MDWAVAYYINVFCLILAAASINVVRSQDYSIYGILERDTITITERKVNQITSNCLEGLGFVTCIPDLPDDDVVFEYSRAYYQNLELIVGSNYCVECCGTSPDHRDTWDLYCQINESPPTTNVYGYEFRLSRNKNADDEEIIRCPLPRTSCNYDGDTAVCDQNDGTYLVGYTVTITVQQYDRNFLFWRGVSKCEAEPMESTVPLVEGDYFRERYILVHNPIDTFVITDYAKVAIIFVCCVTVLYATLYFCRRKRCEYCQQKLVVSRRLCYKCVIVGAQPPDPVLLRALEQKGAALQGELPERFPGATCFTKFVREIWALCCCCGCYIRCSRWCCKWCCCCCCCCSSICFSQKVIPHYHEDDVTPFSVVDYSNEEMGDNDAIGRQLAISRSSNDAPVESGESVGTSSSSGKKKNKKRKKTPKERNPNVLEYPPEIIYAAVKHPAVVSKV